MRRRRRLDRQIGQHLHRLMVERIRIDLAGAIGVDIETTIAYETGQRHIPSEHLLNLARLLDVPVSRFYGEPPPG